VKGIDSLSRDTFFNICRRIDNVMPVDTSLIGCSPQHSEEIVTKIVYFYLVTRMHFIMRAAKKELKQLGRNKALKKQSKLVNK